MGAGASVISKNEEETKATSQDQGNVTKTIAPAKAPPKEGAAVNGKSKFPSAKSSAQRPEVKMTPNVINKEHSPDIYNVEIAADVPCINVLKVSTVYRLRVSVESLDILREGSDALIIQFPYQSISSWGSSPSAFQFTVFNYSTHTENIKNDNENTKYDTENIIREDNKIGGVGVNNNLNNNLNSNINKNESNLLLLPTCQSERTQEFHSEMKKWQDTSFATITDKSDFISTEDSDKKHLQSQQQLQEELEQNDQHLVVDENDGEDVIIILKTTSALLIEQSTMSAVQKLMRDIERSAVSKADFDKLLEDIVDPSTGGLQADWEDTILKYSKTRAFLAKQAMDLLILVGPFSPFEKHDLACLLYKKILNKGAFQLIVNTFDDIHDRQNLIHRLKLDNRFNKNNSGEELVSDCSAINKVTRH